MRAGCQVLKVAVITGITRIGVKGLVECTRLQTLNRQALQQVQVDVHYLRPQLRRYCCQVPAFPVCP